MKNNSTIQLKVDETKLVTNLRHAFTRRSNVISELMQNARRAGATEICLTIDDQRIIVDDNGSGIDDFSDLLTVASSGWDAQTIADESPFGLGFLAALYACQSIQIESRGTLLRASTKDILNQQMITLSTSLVHVGTTISLLRHDYPLDSLQEDIVKLAQGFPIKVFLNDNEIARPHAIDQLHGIETEMGFFHLKGIHDANTSVVKNTQVYLQGLPIRYNEEDTFHRRFNNNFLIDLGKVGISQGVNIVHLDSKQFIARVPDRDVLMDSKAVEEQIATIAREVFLAHLKQQKTKLSGEAFVNQWWRLAHTYLRHQKNEVFKALFNDIEFIPAPVLSIVTDYPYILKTDED
ncbi:MAG: ATP-binding protein, partial [Gammaproteobacteria bacterium]|nr:ATP-binding protein [Gammaproteobacteria bacterium]